MANWYIKEFAKLTDVSVRTLHHYDRIDLLKPSIRTDSGYRVYSEQDLMTLQRIIALKFFGFTLSDIKTLLMQDTELVEQFKIQSKLLKQKAKALLQASDSLERLIGDCQGQTLIPWKTVIKSLEVYKMAKQLENAWVADVLDVDQLKRYAVFEKELKARYTEEEMQARKASWGEIVANVEKNIKNSPDSPIGRQLAKQCIDWANELYGKEHMDLKMALWEKGFMKGKTDNAHGLTLEASHWLDQAMSCYWRERAYAVLGLIEQEPPQDVAEKWAALLNEMFGDLEQGKREVYRQVLNNENLSQAQKNWLKKYGLPL